MYDVSKQRSAIVFKGLVLGMLDRWRNMHNVSSKRRDYSVSSTASDSRRSKCCEKLKSRILP